MSKVLITRHHTLRLCIIKNDFIIISKLESVIVLRMTVKRRELNDVQDIFRKMHRASSEL